MYVEEDASKEGNLLFVNFEHIFWHVLFEKLLDTIKEHSKTGFSVKCGIEWVLYPFIIILSADYEEQ